MMARARVPRCAAAVGRFIPGWRACRRRRAAVRRASKGEQAMGVGRGAHPLRPRARFGAVSSQCTEMRNAARIAHLKDFANCVLGEAAESAQRITRETHLGGVRETRSLVQTDELGARIRVHYANAEQGH